MTMSRRITSIALLGFLITGLIATASAQIQSAPPVPFSAGEDLVYQAEFTRALLRGVDVADFHFRVNTPSIASTNVGAPASANMTIVADVVSKGFFAKLFRISF